MREEIAPAFWQGYVRKLRRKFSIIFAPPLWQGPNWGWRQKFIKSYYVNGGESVRILCRNFAGLAIGKPSAVGRLLRENRKGTKGKSSLLGDPSRG